MDEYGQGIIKLKGIKLRDFLANTHKHIASTTHFTYLNKFI